MSADQRVTIGLRIPPQLRARLKDSARAHGVGINWLAEKALTDFLDRLLPPEEVRWTRPVTPPRPLPQATGGNWQIQPPPVIERQHRQEQP